MRVVLGGALLLAACSSSAQEVQRQGTADPVIAIDSVALLRDVGILAHDSMQGRAAATPGNAAARRFLLREFERIGLQPVGGQTYAHPFSFTRRDVSVDGVNVLGMVRGTAQPERYIVVTAHYDHVGVREGEIYNGADDNASGTSALLRLAEYFRRHAPRHSIIFAALDAEEMGLQGARAFVANPPVPKAGIILNVNMDMVGRNDRGELYVAGTHHYPQLLAHVQAVAADAEVRLIPGHDTPNPANPSGDWTNASDHGPFHTAGIPFLYFGVEDHPDYHRPTDDPERIQPGFYPKAVRTVLRAVLQFDRVLN